MTTTGGPSAAGIIGVEQSTGGANRIRGLNRTTVRRKPWFLQCIRAAEFRLLGLGSSAAWEVRITVSQRSVLISPGYLILRRVRELIALRVSIECLQGPRDRGAPPRARHLARLRLRPPSM